MKPVRIISWFVCGETWDGPGCAPTFCELPQGHDGPHRGHGAQWLGCALQPITIPLTEARKPPPEKTR